MSIYSLKPKFQAMLRPLAGALARAGVTANQVTIAATTLSVLLSAFIVWQLPDTRAFLLLPFWMFTLMACNALDGILAREFGLASRLGAYLNELSDVISDIALLLPFAVLPPFSPLWTGTVIMFAIISEYAGALGPLVGASRRYEGPMGKSDRAFVIGVLGLCVGLAAPLPAWAAYVMPALVVALAATIVNRVRAGVAEGDQR